MQELVEVAAHRSHTVVVGSIRKLDLAVAKVGRVHAASCCRVALNLFDRSRNASSRQSWRVVHCRTRRLDARWQQRRRCWRLWLEWRRRRRNHLLGLEDRAQQRAHHDRRLGELVDRRLLACRRRAVATAAAGALDLALHHRHDALDACRHVELLRGPCSLRAAAQHQHHVRDAHQQLGTIARVRHLVHQRLDRLRALKHVARRLLARHHQVVQNVERQRHELQVRLAAIARAHQLKDRLDDLELHDLLVAARRHVGRQLEQLARANHQRQLRLAGLHQNVERLHCQRSKLLLLGHSTTCKSQLACRLLDSSVRSASLQEATPVRLDHGRRSVLLLDQPNRQVSANGTLYHDRRTVHMQLDLVDPALSHCTGPRLQSDDGIHLARASRLRQAHSH